MEVRHKVFARRRKPSLRLRSFKRKKWGEGRRPQVDLRRANLYVDRRTVSGHSSLPGQGISECPLPWGLVCQAVFDHLKRFDFMMAYRLLSACEAFARHGLCHPGPGSGCDERSNQCPNELLSVQGANTLHLMQHAHKARWQTPFMGAPHLWGTVTGCRDPLTFRARRPWIMMTCCVRRRCVRLRAAWNFRQLPA